MMACPVCTFENGPLALQCSMCFKVFVQDGNNSRNTVTVLDDDDKLRLLKIVKENKLAELEEMATGGELGRLVDSVERLDGAEGDLRDTLALGLLPKWLRQRGHGCPALYCRWEEDENEQQQLSPPAGQLSQAVGA